MDSKSFKIQATKVSLVSIIGNLILSTLKLIAGIVAHSSAMVSDSVHSASDVFSSIVVIIGVALSSKESDADHPYGHERLECVAAIILATILTITGIGIGYFAFIKITYISFGSVQVPGTLALVAAIVSIIVKEAMFWYTRFYAKKLDSSALMADAWHHRSDALSSIGSLVGIGAAILGYPIMDPIAGLLICAFILKASYDIFKDAIDKMIDKSCDESFINEIRALTAQEAGVLSVDLIKTRMFGNKIYVDIEISADGNRTLNETHAIAENIHNMLENTYPQIKHIMVHVNPK